MIDLRKDRRQYFYIDKKTLEPKERTESVWCSLYEMIIFQNPRTKTEVKIINNDYVKITREEYKIFRKLNQEQKKLFIECKED